MKVFISHSSQDKPFVRRLKRDLKLNYIDYWLDEDELLPGDSLIEKLEHALKDATHLIIVLSPHSIKSDWVKFELENALKYLEEETLAKIIPIHYRKCDVPEVLSPMLRIDLTNEVVYMRHGEMEFLGDAYYQYLGPLVRSINQGERRLIKQDLKDIIGKEIITHFEEDETVVFQYRIIGYKSISKFLANQIAPDTLKKYTAKNISELNPVLLPKQLKSYLGNLEFGDEVVFVNKKGEEITGDFARFSTLNNRIAIPKAIRDFLDVKQIGTYKVIIELKTKKIGIEGKTSIT